MPGFYFTNTPPCEPVNFGSAPCVLEQMTVDSFAVYRNTRDQFMQDKLFMQDDDCAIVLESVIMNKKELMGRYGCSSFGQTVKKMFLEDRRRFFSAFRGMFSGAVYDKADRRWTVFTDQIGNKAVFYYVQDGQVIAGSQLNYVTDTMRANGIERQVDENGIRQFFRYGCYMDDSTGIRQVKRLLPGDCLTIEAGTAQTDTYFSFSEATASDLSDDEAIELLDSTFRSAMRRGLDKNAEYGYTGVIDISGGADSRMIIFTAHALGCRNAIACHYSQTGSYELETAQKIASDLDFEFYYNALDDARFFQDADLIIRLNSGTAFYNGITGGQRMLEALGGKKLGIEFTGLLGDVHEGAMISVDGLKPPSLSGDRYTFAKLPADSLSIRSLGRFKTNNLFWLFARGMMCGMSTFLTRQNYVEPYTPYGDVEFLQACLSIPWDRKVHDKLQLRWLQKKYPQAMRYTYASLGLPLSVTLHPRLEWCANKLGAVKHIIFGKLGKTSKDDMNPVAKWEAEKPWLRPWLENYYRDGLTAVEASGKASAPLLELIKDTYASPVISNKYVVLTILGYFKEYLL